MAHEEMEKEGKGRNQPPPPGASYSSPASLGGLRAADGGTREDKDSEAQRVRVQRVSISSHDRSAF
jgi:hypothetical protein